MSVRKWEKIQELLRPHRLIPEATRINNSLGFIEELRKGCKVELADKLIARDCRTHQLRSGAATTSMVRGPNEMKAHVAEWLRGFPDLKFTIEQVMSRTTKSLRKL